MVTRSGLRAHAAALEAELAKRAPRVVTLKGIFKKVVGDCNERLGCRDMHETGLMEQIVDLAQA